MIIKHNNNLLIYNNSDTHLNSTSLDQYNNLLKVITFGTKPVI